MDAEGSRQNSENGPRWAPVLAVLAVIGATFVAFQPALTADFQENWDDNILIVSNPYFRGFAPENFQWSWRQFWD